ncbi:MAG: hypothetical protein WDW36_001076 [Sanguina aurantia]
MQSMQMRTQGATSCRMAAGRRVAAVSRVASPSLRSTFTSGSSSSVATSVSSAHFAKASRTRVVSVEAVKRSVGDLSRADLEGKRVFVRADLNVPLDKQLNVTDDTRIRAAVPTLKYLLENGAKVLLTSHLGRPKGGPEDKFRLTPVVAVLEKALGKPVKKLDDCIGPVVEKAVSEMKNGELLLLENVRFYPEEEKNDSGFAEKLAANADLYVNDAFGTAHRAHASTEGVTKFLKPSVAGFLLQKELDYLDGAVKAPKRPFVAIVGGSKVSSKITVIESLLDSVDKQMRDVGKRIDDMREQRATGVLAQAHSALDAGNADLARKLEAMAKAKGVQLLLPTDVIVADKFDANANTQTVSVDNIPEGWMGLDIGPDSLKSFQAELADAKTVIWNGPMGVFEFPAFAAGTVGIANTLASLTPKGCITIIGGGDSVAAVEQAGVADQMSHISTGGGASLELLEGKVLPGVAALDEKL